MRPYYEDASVTLYHGDCREVSFARASADLLLADPPYGVNWQSGRRHQQFDRLANDDGDFPLLDVLGGLLPALRRGRHIYCFGLSDFGALPIASAVDLIWDKEILGPGDLTLPWGPQHERVLFGVYEYSAANRAKGYGALSARLRRGSVIRSQRLQSGEVRLHPTQKPVDILRMLIESSTVLGETVLDPFAGVGSTGVAAVMEGRRAVLIELEERYCEVAADRLRKIQPALALFQETAA